MDTLLSIKLPEAKKSRVKRAKAAFQSNGAIPRKEMSWLRDLYRRHRKAIGELFKARERARVSMARRKMGLTKRDIVDREKERLEGLRARVEDFGI